MCYSHFQSLVPNWVEGFLDCFGFSFYVVTAEKVQFHSEDTKKINKARLWSTLSQDFQSDHTGTITNLRKTQNLKLWLTCRESTWLWRRGRSARWGPWGSSCLPQQLGNIFLVHEYILHIWIYLNILWVQDQISICFEYFFWVQEQIWIYFDLFGS